MLKKISLIFQYLGCTFNNTNDTIMNERKLCQEGYYISQVLKDGTMDKVGVKKGDILCSFDNLQVDNFGEIYIQKLDIKFHIMDYLKYKHVGDEINITIIRENTNEILKKENNFRILIIFIKYVIDIQNMKILNI